MEIDFDIDEIDVDNNQKIKPLYLSNKRSHFSSTGSYRIAVSTAMYGKLDDGIYFGAT